MAVVEMEEVFEKSFELQQLLSEAENDDSRIKFIKEYINSVECGKLPHVPPFSKEWEWFNVDKPLAVENLLGKVVVLDFFTYCCINCIHILPALHGIEQRYSQKDGLIVIGIHSAKFANEKVSANILNAVLRYDITHPVANDSKAALWFQMQIQCWPTLVVLGPKNQILFLLMGEGHMKTLEQFINVAIEYYQEKGEILDHTIHLTLNKETLPPTELLFPGKVSVDNAGKRLVISDTGHHRIVVTDKSGIVKNCIGTGQPGLRNGNFMTALFNAPQGLAWLGDKIFVADTENHAIRLIDLMSGTVSTLVGTGQQGKDYEGGGIGTEQPISSPWDLVLGSSIGSSELDLLYIAMAGTHQIWIYFLKDGKWLQNRDYKKGTCVRFAGSGIEENRNNNYPHAAAFAQPSGLCLGNGYLYVADSESSSIRTVNISDGSVRGLVGATRDPRNLFAFGDVHGKGFDVKLQHPLGVALYHDNDKATLLIADSYNHKIKTVNLTTKECETFLGSGNAGNVMTDDLLKVEINEPGGICVDITQRMLFIADTNNHALKVYNFQDSKFSEVPIIFPDVATERTDCIDGNHNMSVESTDVMEATKSLRRKEKKVAVKVKQNPLLLGPADQVQFKLALQLATNLHLSEEAPSTWQLFTLDDTLDDVLIPGLSETEGNISDLSNQPVIFLTLPEDLKVAETDILIECHVFFCADDGACRMRTIVFQQPLVLQPSDKVDGKSVMSINLEYDLKI